MKLFYGLFQDKMMNELAKAITAMKNTSKNHLTSETISVSIQTNIAVFLKILPKLNTLIQVQSTPTELTVTHVVFCMLVKSSITSTIGAVMESNVI